MTGPFYHWSPTGRRDSILEGGLLVGQQPTVSTEPQPCIGLSVSPRLAWEVSGAMPWVDVKTWDLWQVTLEEVDAMLTVHTSGGLVLQVFCDQPIPPSCLFWCGERMRAEGRRQAIEEVSKGLPASSAEITAWLDAVARRDARMVAAGRRQAAEELMRQVGNTTGDQTPDQIRWFALEVLNDIAEGAPAEPVEEADRG